MTNLGPRRQGSRYYPPRGSFFAADRIPRSENDFWKSSTCTQSFPFPPDVFCPYTGVKTNVIFFNRPREKTSTESVWFYELTNDGFELKQTRRPMEGEQLSDFLKKCENRVEGANSWIALVEDIKKNNFDLSARNPNHKDDYEHLPALEIVQSIKAKEQRVMELLDELEGMLEKQ